MDKYVKNEDVDSKDSSDDMANAVEFEPVQAFKCKICGMIVQVPETHKCNIGGSRGPSGSYTARTDFKWWNI